MRSLIIAVLVLVVTPAVDAGQFTYKTASVMPSRQCDGETWYGDHDETYGAEFTCRLDAPFSLKLEAGLPRNGPESLAVEAKYEFRGLRSDRLALGITAASGMETGSGSVTGGAVIVPLSLRLVPDRLALHLNAGASHSRDTGDTSAYWGGAVELALTGPFTAVAETFGTGGDDPTVRTGLQASLLDGRLALSVSYLDELETGGVHGWAAGAAFQVVTF